MRRDLGPCACSMDPVASALGCFRLRTMSPFSQLARRLSTLRLPAWHGWPARHELKGLRANLIVVDDCITASPWVRLNCFSFGPLLTLTTGAALGDNQAAASQDIAMEHATQAMEPRRGTELQALAPSPRRSACCSAGLRGNQSIMRRPVHRWISAPTSAPTTRTPQPSQLTVPGPASRRAMCESLASPTSPVPASWQARRWGSVGCGGTSPTTTHCEDTLQRWNP